ncbi:MAG: type II toxin-antitoxin system VapC family toxin [Thermodesulfobacteriota bacterium]
MKLVLDTCSYSAFAEGEERIVAAIADHGDELFFPSIVLGELAYGFLRGSRRQFNEEKLHEIISRLQIRVLSVTADVARKYSVIYQALASRGQKIPINDVWIAACCMEIGGVLLTLDRHFAVIEQIEVFPL